MSSAGRPAFPGLQLERQAYERRLVWLYGKERAFDIVMGRDPATEADLAKWNALGQPKLRVATS